jgi:hypothetical protein
MNIVLFYESVEAFEVYVNGCGIPKQGCCKIGKKLGPRGGRPLAEREVSSSSSISQPPKAAIKDYATALPTGFGDIPRLAMSVRLLMNNRCANFYV